MITSATSGVATSIQNNDKNKNNKHTNKIKLRTEYKTKRICFSSMLFIPTNDKKEINLHCLSLLDNRFVNNDNHFECSYARMLRKNATIIMTSSCYVDSALWDYISSYTYSYMQISFFFRMSIVLLKVRGNVQII